MAINRLKEVLEKEGIRNSELARKTGLNESTISRYARQKRTPSPTTVSKITKGVNFLVGEEKYTNTYLFPSN